MRLSVGAGLASLFLGGVFLSALAIAITGSRSVLSDAFLVLAVVSVIALAVLRRLRSLPNEAPPAASADSKAVVFNGWAASFLGGFVLLLIYRGSFSDYRQLIAIGSCVLSALGAVILMAEYRHQYGRN